jgi:hypothetical protein
VTDERAMPPDLFHQLTLTILDRSVDEGLRTIKSIRSYLDTWERFLQDRQQLLDHLLIDHNASPPDLDADPVASTDGTGKHTAMTWQASWPPTRSRCDSRHPPDSNSSGVLGPARRGRGTVGDDLCVRPNHAALDPHERPVHWPSPRAQSWCSDGSPAKAASRSPARSSRSATATPAGPSPCSSLAQSDQRIDRPPLAERPPSGRLVSGTRSQASVDGHAGVCGDLRSGRMSGRLPPAWTDTAGHFRCGRPPCRPGSGHRGRTAASGVRPADGGGYRNRSPGWRPLVGCSQRRWTRTIRAVRRLRSWLRT